MIASSGSIASSCICPVLPTAHWTSTQFRLRQELDPNASSPRNAPIAPSVHRLGFTVVTTSRLALRLLIFPADLRLGSWNFPTRFDHFCLISLSVASQLFVDAYTNCDWLYSLYVVDEFLTQRNLGRERNWRTSRFWLILCEHDPTDIEALKMLIELRRVSKRVSYLVDCTIDTEVEYKLSSLKGPSRVAPCVRIIFTRYPLQPLPAPP